MDEIIKKIVKERLRAMPPNISFSIGEFGDFTRDQLIHEVDIGSEIGKETVEMELNFIRKMPRILEKLESQ